MAIFPRAHGTLARPGTRFPKHLLAALLAAAALLIAGPQFQQFTDISSGTIAPVSSTTSLIGPAPGGAGPVSNSVSGSLSTESASSLALLSETSSVRSTTDAIDASSPTLSSATSSLEPVVSANDTTEPATVLESSSDTVTTAPAEAPVPVSPIDRWAAAGISIETQGQQLDDYSLANIDAALSAIPTGLLSQLGNPAFGALHVLVNTEGRTMSGAQPYRGPANFFSTNESTNELVLYPQQSVFTIVHELGHAYNLRHVGAGRYAMVLLDPEMQSFLAATGWHVDSTDDEIRAAVDHMHVKYTYTGSFHWSHLSNDDPLEDFANSFATYLLDPVGLAQSSPDRYDWMSQHLPR